MRRQLCEPRSKRKPAWSKAGTLLLTALMVWPQGPRAQPVDGSRMQAFMASGFYKELINRAIAALPPAVFRRCPSLVSSGSRLTELRPIAFGADGFPNSGLWKQTFPVSGCGDDTELNFYFHAGVDEKINTIVGFPGTSRADLALQNDAKKFATIGASTAAKTCRTFDVKKTSFRGFGVPNPTIPDPGPVQRFRPWWEMWTMTGCDRTFDVPLDFVPDENGTRIIQPSGVIER